MNNKIKTIYVIHHSHTDIGYTDLQERIMETQADYIRTVLKLMEVPENRDFRWNCETLFCVEAFFKTATEQEREAFFRLAAGKQLGTSANYLNFTDLLDKEAYARRLNAWQKVFREHGAQMNTAMIADINGISMGYRDAMLDAGIEFLYANIHCHHGMYPLYQNQTAFFWENRAGKRLLVWNGEHYNLGNVLGLKPNRVASFMHRTYLGQEEIPENAVETLHQNLKSYLSECETQGYPYDFIPVTVSGVFSDNAPPEVEILRTIQAHNARYPELHIQMMSLQELYDAIRDKLADAPVYRGDLTDWWANGVGSTPYAVKHYLAARQRYHLCRRLEPQVEARYPELVREAEDNLLLYAEHTWGHSSTITNPYDTMVLDLDMRKNSYASKAHEAASRMLTRVLVDRGDVLRYYATEGSLRVCNPGALTGAQVIEFFIECGRDFGMELRDAAGTVIPCQVSSHPRGRRITFMDSLPAFGEKTYTYREKELALHHMNTRRCYVGAEQVRDIVNDYDSQTYRLPYGFENDFFRLCCRPGEGVTSFVEKRTGRELLGRGEGTLFTPIHQITPVSPEAGRTACPEELERRLLGRNIRGQHAITSYGRLEAVLTEERGAVFTRLRLRYTLPGTVRADVILVFYAAVPRVDFTLELGKTLSSDIESIFLPLSMNLPGSQLWLRKGSEAFRPGIDQIPGTCMEFYMSDYGAAYTDGSGSVLIASRDVPLLYMGQMAHHPIRLCDGAAENNARPVYSWVMNNNWETNFKMDLSGFSQFRYTLWLSDACEGEQAMDELEERVFPPEAFAIAP